VTPVAELGVLGRVDLSSLPQDLLRELIVVAGSALGRVRVDLRAVDREHLNTRQPGLCAQRKHLAEQISQGALVTLTETRDRRVIGLAVGSNHPVVKPLNAGALDLPRGPLPARVRIDQHRDHHRRIVRRSAMAISAIVAIERAQIHRVDGGNYEPREMIGRQPLIPAGRQQERLITVTPQEVLRHPEIVTTRPDDTAPFLQQPPCNASVAARVPL